MARDYKVIKSTALCETESRFRNRWEQQRNVHKTFFLYFGSITDSCPQRLEWLIVICYGKVAVWMSLRSRTTISSCGGFCFVRCNKLGFWSETWDPLFIKAVECKAESDNHKVERSDAHAKWLWNRGRALLWRLHWELVPTVYWTVPGHRNLDVRRYTSIPSHSL